MKKVQKNSFEKMCDRLEENFVLNENEIKYVKKHLYPIKEDKDMLLKLKAEALEDDYIAVMSFAITMLASEFLTPYETEPLSKEKEDAFFRYLDHLYYHFKYREVDKQCLETIILSFETGLFIANTEKA